MQRAARACRSLNWLISPARFLSSGKDRISRASGYGLRHVVCRISSGRRRHPVWLRKAWHRCFGVDCSSEDHASSGRAELARAVAPATDVFSSSHHYSRVGGVDRCVAFPDKLWPTTGGKSGNRQPACFDSKHQERRQNLVAGRHVTIRASMSKSFESLSQIELNLKKSKRSIGLIRFSADIYFVQICNTR